MPRTILAACAIALLLLTACSGGNDAGSKEVETDVSGAVVTACNDLKTGNWNGGEPLGGLLASSDSPDLFDDALGDSFGSYMSNVAGYGNWYDRGTGYTQLVPPTWTAQDAEDEAMKNLNYVWSACAEHVSGFPKDVDSDVADQVKQGAVAMLIASTK